MRRMRCVLLGVGPLLCLVLLKLLQMLLLSQVHHHACFQVSCILTSIAARSATASSIAGRLNARKSTAAALKSSSSSSRLDDDPDDEEDGAIVIYNAQQVKERGRTVPCRGSSVETRRR